MHLSRSVDCRDQPRQDNYRTKFPREQNDCNFVRAGCTYSASRGAFSRLALQIWPHIAGRAARRGNVAIQRVIHHHAIGIEPPS